MAKTIATITGTALKPGVSRNGRWYKPEHVAEAVRHAQERIRSGQKPMVMLTFHGADDNSREIAASLSDVSLNENGGMDFAAGFTDTPAGWDIARLADTTDGKPAHLRNVSIRGAWTGRVRKERGPDGQVAETADGVEVEGIDFTKAPGVSGAEIKTFDWVTGGATETTERVLITESVQEARLTITEEAPTLAEVSEATRSALRGILGAGMPHVLENGECRTCPVTEADDPKKPFGDVSYADPGYQKDGKKRYPLDSDSHVRAAYSYISQAKNAALYTSAQLKRVKGRIKAAMSKIGAKVAAEGWTSGPETEVTEALAEYAGMDASCAGSYSLSATNGPTTVTVCSYGCDPAELRDILAQACKGAGLALSALDPDMDADIDVDDQAESAEDPGALAEASTPAAVTETATPAVPAPEPAAADREGTEAPAVSETTTTETAATAPASLTQADLNAAVAQALEAAETARAARKAAKRAAAAAEAAPAAPAAVTETATPQAPAVDIAALVKEGIAAALATEGAAETVTESVEDQVKRLVAAGVTEAKQQIVASGGGPARKGLVTEHTAPAATDGSIPADYPMKDGKMLPSEGWTEDQNRAAGVQLQQYVLGARASQ